MSIVRLKQFTALGKLDGKAYQPPLSEDDENDESEPLDQLLSLDVLDQLSDDELLDDELSRLDQLSLSSRDELYDFDSLAYDTGDGFDSLDDDDRDQLSSGTTAGAEYESSRRRRS